VIDKGIQYGYIANKSSFIIILLSNIDFSKLANILEYEE
jgi:hypothetical protein